MANSKQGYGVGHTNDSFSFDDSNGKYTTEEQSALPTCPLVFNCSCMKSRRMRESVHCRIEVSDIIDGMVDAEVPYIDRSMSLGRLRRKQYDIVVIPLTRIAIPLTTRFLTRIATI